MKASRRSCTFAVAALALGVPLAASAQGANLPPGRPIHIVVPTPAGGPSDTAARLVAQSMSTILGQQVVVENKPGAGGSIAAQSVMTAAPDGHTLLWAQAAMAGLPFLQKNSPYKSMSELAPVSNILNFGFALFVNKDLPVNNFADLVAHARGNPGKLGFATGTLGEYMVAEYVFKATGIKAVRVPYKGGAQLMPDLISGQVQLNFGPILSGLQHVKAGKLKMLATALPNRIPLLPDLPTFTELGVPPADLPTWNALFAPPGTPTDAIQRIADAAARAVRTPTVHATLEAQGASPLGSTPQQLAMSVEAANGAWKTFVRDYNLPQE